MMDISLKGKEQGMKDDRIVDLYWIRSEDAIRGSFVARCRLAICGTCGQPGGR